jgi:hypothetical protein
VSVSLIANGGETHPIQVSRRTVRDTHTPGILQKRLQVDENKGRELEKEAKEAASA